MDNAAGTGVSKDLNISNDGGKVVVQWLVHGTSLLRCSPAHVRPLVEDTRTSFPVNPADALKDLEELQARSTTQFRDLSKDTQNLEPTLEDLLEFQDPPPDGVPADNVSDGYAPTEPLDEAEVPGIVSMMMPDLREERETTPRRRESNASTELPKMLEL